MATATAPRVTCAACGQKVEQVRGGRVRRHYIATDEGNRVCRGRPFVWPPRRA